MLISYVKLDHTLYPINFMVHLLIAYKSFIGATL
jgi:hypothetical protein